MQPGVDTLVARVARTLEGFSENGAFGKRHWPWF